jgi:hypothetical protein
MAVPCPAETDKRIMAKEDEKNTDVEWKVLGSVR